MYLLQIINIILFGGRLIYLENGAIIVLNPLIRRIEIPSISDMAINERNRYIYKAYVMDVYLKNGKYIHIQVGFVEGNIAEINRKLFALLRQ